MLNATKREWALDFFNKCEEKISRILEDISIDYPMDIRGNKKKYEETEHTPFNWTSGFWGGMMWLLYLQTRKDKYKERAIKCSERMQESFGGNEHFYSLDNHDLGFVHTPTSVAHYKILGDENAKIRGLHAATLLAGRFNLNGNFIRAWSVANSSSGNNVDGYAIIDCMLNLPLLYWASELTSDPRYSAIAKANADTVMKEFIKQDGSVYHIVEFDTHTGKVKGYPKGQGYASGSSCSRGQTWAIYGFILSYIHSKDEKYLNAAKGVADYIVKNIGNYTIAPVDYMQPTNVQKVDASASAITACGMLELAKALDGKESEKYEEFAIKLIEGLYEDCDFSDKNQAIIQNACEFYNGENFPIIYADYFLIEALMKYIGEVDFLIW